MNEFAAWAALGSAVIALLALAKFWMDMGATKLQAKQASIKAEAVSVALSDYKAFVAEKYASNHGLSQSETRLTEAIEGMRADFRGLTGRLDSMLGAMHRP